MGITVPRSTVRRPAASLPPLARLGTSTARQLQRLPGGGFVPYTVVGGVVVALGDPAVARGGLATAVEQFAATCRGRRLGCVFHQTDAPTPYRDLGFRTLPLGSEAVLDPRRLLRLEGNQYAELRYAHRRAARERVRFELLAGPVAIAQHGAQIQELSLAWLATHGGQEMTFSLGSLRSFHDPEIRAGLAFDRRGRLQALVSWLPGRDGVSWTLDVMRRRPDAAYGAMEALLLDGCRQAVEHDLPRISLGLAPFHLESADQRGFLYQRAARLRRIASLQRFKAKFLPDWEVRYLSIAPGTHLFAGANAVLRAHAGCESMLDQVRFLLRWSRTSA